MRSLLIILLIIIFFNIESSAATGAIGGYVGINTNSFLNSTFSENLKNEVIDPKAGLEMGLRVITIPLLIDFGGFYQKFELPEFTHNDTIVVEYFGCDISAAIGASIAEGAVFPFLGLGYQASELSAYNFEEKPYRTFNHLYLHSGLNMILSKKAGFSVDYRRAFFSKTNWERIGVSLHLYFNVEK